MMRQSMSRVTAGAGRVQHRATLFEKCCAAPRGWGGVSFRFMGWPTGRSGSRATSCNTFREVLHGAAWMGRSEEHTSELQSLMRISYAVFCLKKKKKQINNIAHAIIHLKRPHITPHNKFTHKKHSTPQKRYQQT